MSRTPNGNIHGKTSGGIYKDHRFDLIWKVARKTDISKTAQTRLKWMDYYAKCDNAALTCRYFGISESCFWKWKKRYVENGLAGLEDRSTRPKRLREPEASPELVEKIQRLRKMFPHYGKEKIHKLLDEPISVSTVGRTISRFKMFYRAKKKRRGYGWKWGKRQRVKNLVAHGKPGEHLQMDTIVLYRNSRAYYIKTAIDTVTKIAFAYVYSRNTSRTAVDFLHKLQSVLPYQIKNMHTDNGSEFLGEFHIELEKQGIAHYFSYPHCPKQHGSVERFNRTLQEEWLREANFHPRIPDLNRSLNKWLITYNFYRPHASLSYNNPLAFFDQNFVPSNHQNLLSRPSSMYWTYTDG